MLFINFFFFRFNIEGERKKRKLKREREREREREGVRDLIYCIVSFFSLILFSLYFILISCFFNLFFKILKLVFLRDFMLGYERQIFFLFSYYKLNKLLLVLYIFISL